MSEVVDELEILFPDFKAKIRSGEVQCNPFGLCHFGVVGKILKKYSERLTGQTEAISISDLVLSLLSEGDGVVGDCLQLMAMSTGKEIEELKALRGDEQFSVLEKVFEANLDFFINRIAPAVKKGMAMFGLQPGQAQQPVLSVPDSVGQKSDA